MFAEKVAVDCWKTPGQAVGRQVSGKGYFTDKRIVFLASGLIGTAAASWEIEMKDIQGGFKRSGTEFMPPLNKVEIYKLKKSLKPSEHIFVEAIEGEILTGVSP